MPSPNSLNPSKGRDFQTLAARVLETELGVRFLIDRAIPIGSPPKLHRFDLVSDDERFVGECKNYSWTETGNMPSAKMAFLNEAVLYLSLLPKSTQKFIVMRLDAHPKRGTLLEYYLRTFRHLLSGVAFYEIDLSTGVARQHRIDC